MHVSGGRFDLFEGEKTWDEFKVAYKFKEPNEKGHLGFTPLRFAVLSGNVAVAKEVREYALRIPDEHALRSARVTVPACPHDAPVSCLCARRPPRALPAVG